MANEGARTARPRKSSLILLRLGNLHSTACSKQPASVGGRPRDVADDVRNRARRQQRKEGTGRPTWTGSKGSTRRFSKHRRQPRRTSFDGCFWLLRGSREPRMATSTRIVPSAYARHSLQVRTRVHESDTGVCSEKLRHARRVVSVTREVFSVVRLTKGECNECSSRNDQREFIPALEQTKDILQSSRSP